MDGGGVSDEGEGEGLGFRGCVSGMWDGFWGGDGCSGWSGGAGFVGG